MSGERFSTDVNESSNIDNTRPSIGLNQAMLGDESFSTDVNESSNIDNTRCRHCSSSRSAKRAISGVKSTIAYFSEKIIRPTRPAETEDQEAREASDPNKAATITSAAAQAGLKVKVSKPRIISDEILLGVEYCCASSAEATISSAESRNKSELYLAVSEDDSAFQLTPSVELSNISESSEQFTDSSLDESNIWPALKNFETTLTNNDDNTDRNNCEKLARLNEEFTQSPRRFTETLLTIMEESIETHNDTNNAIIEFFKRRGKEKLQENEPSPSVSSTAIDKELMGLSISPIFPIESGDIPSKPVNLYQNIFNNGKTPEKRRVPRRASPASPAVKNYPKTPRLVGKRETPKPTIANRLRIGSASNEERSPRQTKIKPPTIVIQTASPVPPPNTVGVFLTPRKNSEDDEYLTAESETEESLDSTVLPEEPIASSSQRFDLSRVASCHKEWVETYKQVSTLQSQNLSSSESRKKRFLASGIKSENRWLRELQLKRKNCFNVVDKLRANNVESVAAIEPKPADSCNQCKLTMEFVNTLRACSDYFTYATKKLQEPSESATKSKRFLTTTSINLASKPKSPSPHHPAKKSPRKLQIKRRSGSKSPGKRRVNPYCKPSPMLLKRRSLISSGIDVHSLGSVTEIRKIFSPRQRGAAGSPRCSGKENAEPEIVSKCSNLEIPGTSSHSDSKVIKAKSKKFGHVVSPVREYIRGNK